MNRFTSQLIRLYSPLATLDSDGKLALFDASGRVRALVLELRLPADWAALALVWQGVQADLGLPAPAIVVQGVDAYQLWFSLAEPLAAQTGRSFLQALAARYLADVAPSRLRLLPAALPATDPALPPPQQHAAVVPQRMAEEQWSAFVSADLAPLFTQTPWLDMAPNLEGQAGLLATLQCMQPAALQEATARLRPAEATAPAARTTGPGALAAPGDQTACAHRDPKRFLLDVMNDEGVALALRIEAAKALLPYVQV